MPKIQIDQYSFIISAPYNPGPHLLTEAEATALNSVRAKRLHDIVAKRLQKRRMFAGALLSNVQIAILTEEVQELDEEFVLSTHDAKRVKKQTVHDEIESVARESAEASFRKQGREATPELMTEAIQALLTDTRIVAEGRRRFETYKEIMQEALAELQQ